tara:strand:+ start:742 stop:1209 length:468 start_codon:yes stop_codon:yes gene_type:complete
MNYIIVNEFFLVAIFGFLSNIAYLITTYILDNFIGYSLSNFIGLLVDILIDFFSQSFIFNNKIMLSDNIIYRFFIAKIIVITISQFIFVIYIKYISYLFQNNIQKKLKKLIIKYKINTKLNIEELYILTVRITLGLFTYMFLIFPLAKYYTFKKK